MVINFDCLDGQLEVVIIFRVLDVRHLKLISTVWTFSSSDYLYHESLDESHAISVLPTLKTHLLNSKH